MVKNGSDPTPDFFSSFVLCVLHTVGIGITFWREIPPVKEMLDFTSNVQIGIGSTRVGVNLTFFALKMQTVHDTKSISSPQNCHYKYPTGFAGVSLVMRF